MERALRLLGGGCAVLCVIALVGGCASGRRKPLAQVAAGDDRAVVARIDLGVRPNTLAVTPDGLRVYVTAAGKIHVIDAATRNVVETIALSHDPAGIAISADGTHAFVVDTSSQVLWIIDTANNRLAATIDIGSPKPATTLPSVVVTQDGAVAYITNPGDNTLVVVDIPNAFVRTRIGLHMRPAGAALSPDRKLVYVSGCVAECTSGMVAVVDTRTYVINDSIPTARPLSPIAVNPTGKFAYAASGSEVLVIDTATNNVTAQVPGEIRSEVHTTSDGAFAYAHGSQLAVLETSTNTLVASIPLPANVTGFAISPDAALAYVVGPGGIYVIDARFR